MAAFAVRSCEITDNIIRIAGIDVIYADFEDLLEPSGLPDAPPEVREES